MIFEFKIKRYPDGLKFIRIVSDNLESAKKEVIERMDNLKIKGICPLGFAFTSYKIESIEEVN